VLSGRGLCEELITRPEESYRLWCVVVCDLEKLKNEEAVTSVGSQRHSKKKSIKQIVVIVEAHNFVIYLQSFIQHSTVKVNSIRRGNYCGSSVRISTQQIKCVLYYLHSPNT